MERVLDSRRAAADKGEGKFEGEGGLPGPHPLLEGKLMERVLDARRAAADTGEGKFEGEGGFQVPTLPFKANVRCRQHHFKQTGSSRTTSKLEF